MSSQELESRRPSDQHDDTSSVLSLEDRGAKRQCLKNLLLVSLSALFIFTSFMSIQNLESSINQGVGDLSMTCLYIGLIIACIFTPSVIKYTGYKWAIVTCLGTHCLFAGAHFYPKIYVLAPVCAIVGLASGPFWAGQGQFVTTLAVQYGEYTETSPEVCISRFNGVFYMFLQSAQVWGNMISSIILKPVAFDKRNLTYLVNETCGAKFEENHIENGSSIIPPRINEPTQTELYILMGTYLGCCVVGFLVMSLFSDDIKPLPDTDLKSVKIEETLVATLGMHCDPCMLLLVPLLFYNGMEQVFLFGDFTEAFVACELGVGYIGYAMITFGAVSMLSSFFVGQLERRSGRLVLLVLAGILDFGLLLVMLEWNPGDARKDNWLLYFIPGTWGIADSIWQTTTSSLLAVEFAHAREAAFSTFRLWQGAGMGATFAYSLFTGMRVKIYVTLALLIVSMASYVLMELFIKRRMKKPYVDLYAPIVE